MSEFFTSQTKVDVDTIMEVLCKAVRVDGDQKNPRSKSSLRFLEIGVFYGSTARGVKEWCDGFGAALEYFGCDDFSHPNFHSARIGGQWPFTTESVIHGASWDVFHKFPDDMDVVFVDGNHSGNAVILDTVLYAPKVRAGGFMMFHDTAPHIQQTMPEQNAPQHPWWSNSVNAAHALIGWPWKGWKLWYAAHDPNASFGGIAVYQKL